MLDMLWDILISAFNTITSFLTAQYFFSLFSKNQKDKKVLTLIAFIIFFIEPLFVDNGIINMAVLILCIFALSLNYEFKIYNKILFTGIFIALNVLVEVFTVLIMTYLFGSTTKTIVNTDTYFAFGAIMSKLIFVAFCYIIGTAKNKVLIGSFKINWISIYVLPIATFFVSYALYCSTFYYENNFSMKSLSLVSLILLVVSNILIIQLVNFIHDFVENENKLIVAEKLVKQQRTEYQILIENNDTMVKIRHDHKNFLLGSIAILSKTTDPYALIIKERMSEELDLLETNSSSNLSGDSVLDAIINYKRNEATAKNIEVTFSFKNASNIFISGIDLAILLGNALDNAIEATEKLDKKNKKIDVYFCRKESHTIITILNEVIEPVDVENLKSTKGNNHGYGIVNMQTILDKYNGSIAFDCKNNTFTTIIIFNNK